MLHIAYSDRFVLDLPEGHRFPMIKYELIREQLEYEGTAIASQFFDPGLIEEDIILLTHCRDYWKKFKTLTLSPKEFREIGFPPSEKLVHRCMSSAMGTFYASQKALEHGIGMNVAGGTHHAFRAKGEAFCMLNDMAISANYLLHNTIVKKILIVDLDVHQGNGTASIFEQENRVFTFSMHGESNYPLRKEKSDLDIPLKTNTSDNEYLAILTKTLPQLIETQKPDFIFFQAGVDVLETDKLGTLALTKEACKNRDEFVFEMCLKYQIPIAVSMGGGYSVKVSDIVDAHCNTFRLATKMFF